MKNLRNRVQLIGNLGNTPEIKETTAGKKHVRLSLATNHIFINKEGEKTKDTQWHNIITWGKQAEIADKYLSKGQEICIEGKLNYRTYQDNNGDNKYVHEIIAHELLMLKN